MPRPRTGQIVERKTGDARTYALRFTAYGRREYVTLGSSADGWTRQRAEAELANVLADVRRGVWRKESPNPGKPEPTFHEFASEWLASRYAELRPKTIKDYEWALSYHLLPFFKDHRLSQITIEEVDRYKAEKARGETLSASSTNKTLKRLVQILDVAMEYGHVDRNTASGRRRRLKETKPNRTWVEPEQLLALLDGAPAGHRPVQATLAGAGLRVGEAVALDWRDINLATGTLTVQDSKTDAGAGREVDLPGGLIDELKTHKASSRHTEPEDPVFVSGSRNGEHRRQTEDNVRRRLKTAVNRANEALAEKGIEPISERVSPHSLRRTFASLRAALRDDPVYIAQQGGWEDPGFVFSVYQRAANLRERLSGAYLEAFDQALDWARIGTGDVLEPIDATDRIESRLSERA